MKEVFYMVNLNFHNIKVQIPYDDLREWIAEADKLGELRVGEGYNWEEQIGMAAELLQHS
jgi:4-hydroxy-3-polyprenylbenzoate decarboxylase